MKFYRIREECYHRNILQHILSSCTMTIFIETCFNTLYVPPMMQKCPCHDKEDSPHPPSSSGGVTRSHLVQRWTLIVLKEFNQKHCLLHQLGYVISLPVQCFGSYILLQFSIQMAIHKCTVSSRVSPLAYVLYNKLFHDAVKYHLRVQLIGVHFEFTAHTQRYHT